MATVKTQRTVTAVVAVVVGLVASTLVMGNVSAAAGDTVTGSTFEGIDGDLTPTTGKSDWSGTAGSNVLRAPEKLDPNTGALDDSFAGGMKEDTQTLAFVTGSIPSNKSDLTVLRLATENAAIEGRDIFLHLAWQRAQTLGSANMDFEFNQNKCELTTAGLPTTGSSCESTLHKIPTRRAGDMLIAYDFGGNSSTVDLGVYRWLDATLVGTGNDPNGLLALGCEASSAIPCWSARQDLSTIGAVGEISGDRKFGEASINLNTLLGRTTCTAFGSVYLKSRSSSSFTAQMKDFIGPLAQGVTNCHQKAPGRININKSDDAAAPVAATFQLFTDVADPSSTTGGRMPGSAVSGKVCTTSTSDTAEGVDPFVAAGNCSITGIDPGNGGANTGTWYWVVEGTVTNGVFTEGTPAGHGADPTYGTRRRIQVMDASGNTYSMSFVNPRLYKIVVLVCQGTSSLVASSITAFGATTAATSHGPTALGSTAQSAVCGLTGGATYSGSKATLNAITGVAIP